MGRRQIGRSSTRSKKQGPSVARGAGNLQTVDHGAELFRALALERLGVFLIEDLEDLLLLFGVGPCLRRRLVLGQPDTDDVLDKVQGELVLLRCRTLGGRVHKRNLGLGGHLVVDEVSAATLEASITNVTKAVPKTLPIIKARLAVPADVSKLGTQEFCNFIKEEV